MNSVEVMAPRSGFQLLKIWTLLLVFTVGIAESLFASESQPIHTTHLAHGLALQLPSDWQSEAAISPRLRLWRSPAISALPAANASASELLAHSLAEGQRPSICISSSPRSTEQSLSDLREELLSHSLDLFAGAEIISRDPFALGLSATLQFTIGPQRWRQQWLFIEHDQQVISIVLSSSADHWASWQHHRQTIIDSLHWPSADGGKR